MTTLSALALGFTAGAVFSIVTVAAFNFRRGIRIATEAQREQRSKRDRHGRLRVVTNCKGGKA